MTKNTMGTKLPRKLEQKMQIVGEQIKLARLRRNLSVAQVAERATCSPLTVSRIEKGIPTVAQPYQGVNAQFGGEASLVWRHNLLVGSQQSVEFVDKRGDRKSVV